MLIRVYVYFQLFTIALIGLTAYWDRMGVPAGASYGLYRLGILFVYFIPLFPILLLAILWFSRVDQRQKLYLAIVGSFAWVAQVIAAIPGFQ
jgi:Na+/proline symporter